MDATSHLTAYNSWSCPRTQELEPAWDTGWLLLREEPETGQMKVLFWQEFLK